MSLVVAGVASGQVNINGPLTGSQSFTADSTITLSNTYNNTSALTVGSGETATASNGTTITTVIQGEATNPASGNNGLVANTGGTINFSNSTTVVTNSTDPASKMATGILANGGTILLGNDTEVHALKMSGGTAISATSGGSVTVGEDAVLQGTLTGSGVIQSNGTVSRVVIGTKADISNNGFGDSLGSHYGVYASDSGLIEIGGSSAIKTTTSSSTSTNNIGVYATGVSTTINMGEDVSVSTQGSHSYGIAAFVGSSVTGGQTTVTTTGNNSYAVVANSSTAVVMLGADSLITTSGTSGHGINAQSSAQVTLGDGSRVVTHGDSTLGVSAHSGAIVTLGNNFTLQSYGEISYGMQSDGSGGASEIHAGDHFVFESTGLRSRGAQTRRGGQITIGDDAYFSTTGNEATLAHSNETDSILTIGDRAVLTATGKDANGVGSAASAQLSIGEGATITISGDSAIGLFSTGVGSETRIGQEAAITTSGAQSEGAYAASGGYVFIGDESSVTTNGTQSTGLYAYSSAAKIETGTDVAINTIGDGSYGVRAQPDTIVNLGSGNIVDTEGVEAHGLVVNGSGALVTAGDGLQLATLGGKTHSIFANVGQVSLGVDAVIGTFGANSDGVHALGGAQVSIGSGSTVTTISLNSSGLYATGDSTRIEMSADATIKTDGDNSHALFAADGGSISLQDAAITVDPDKTSDIIYTSGQNAEVIGDGVLTMSGGAVFANDNSRINLTLRNGSQFTGHTQTSATNASNALSITGADSLWTLTDDSTLTSLTLDGAAANFSSAPLGTKLAVNDLVQNSNQGTIVLKTDLVAGTADIIEVNNNTAGNYVIDISNQGATDTVGTEVLPLVFTADNGGVFSLAHPVNIGDWRYGLRQVNGQGPWGKQWELYATGRANTAGVSIPASSPLSLLLLTLFLTVIGFYRMYRRQILF